VIFADEPTGNLDTKTGLQILELLQKLHHAGKTIIMVTHEPDIASYGAVSNAHAGRPDRAN